MQAVFSFMTAALFMGLPIAIENKGNLPEGFFFVAISVICFCLLSSLVLASVATWRWKKRVLGSIESIEKSILDSQAWEKNLVDYNRLCSKVNLLKKIQSDKEKINDRRSNLILASMVMFFISIGVVLISYLIAIFMIKR
jgi:hypothetical protein